MTEPYNGAVDFPTEATILLVGKKMRCAKVLATALLAACIGLTSLDRARADNAPFVPSFWDSNRRLPKPDLSAVRVIRFVTDDDYPPFNFLAPDGALTGFNVDLARAICEELQIACTIQVRRWDLLASALEENQADAAIAAIAVNAKTREQFDFTAPYMIMPGRFVAAAQQPPAAAATPEAMAALKVGVIANSAHAAWLKIYFPNLERVEFDTLQAQQKALQNGAVAAIFGDGVALAGWLNSVEASGRYAFFGGPFIDSRYFGEGVAVAVRKNNIALRRALDYALARVAEKGLYTEIYLKYFPIGVF